MVGVDSVCRPVSFNVLASREAPEVLEVLEVLEDLVVLEVMEVMVEWVQDGL